MRAHNVELIRGRLSRLHRPFGYLEDTEFGADDVETLIAAWDAQSTALLAKVQQWREHAKLAQEYAGKSTPDIAAEYDEQAKCYVFCADQLEHLITGEGK